MKYAEIPGQKPGQKDHLRRRRCRSPILGFLLLSGPRAQDKPQTRRRRDFTGGAPGTVNVPNQGVGEIGDIFCRSKRKRSSTSEDLY